MKLIIDTANKEIIKLSLQDNEKDISAVQVEAEQAQAEKLLPAIDKMLKSCGVNKKDLKKIVVADKGDSFTALRIGIVTANTLAYALNIPVENMEGESLEFDGISLVQPKYSKKPNITIAKKKRI